MKAIDAVRMALELNEGDLRVIEAMRDAPLTRPMYRGNHPLWIIGHLTTTEGRMHQIILGEPNPVAHWKPLFDWGTEPVDDASRYPPFDEVLQRFRGLRGRTMKLLSEIGDAGLDQPTKAPPPGLEKSFATIGQTLLTIASHMSYHSGQASVAKKAAGKEPGFTPSPELRAF